VTDDRSTTGEVRPCATRLADEIRRLRRAAGWSQVELARRVGYTRQYVSLAERASHNVPSPELVRSIDRVLAASGNLIILRARAKAEQRTLRQGNPGDEPAPAPLDDPLSGTPQSLVTSRDTLISGQLRILRQVLDAHDLPEDGPVRSPEQLRQAVASIVSKRLRSDYAALAVDMPPLLSEVLRAMANSHGSARIDTARLLVQVYRAADALADKFGYYDLSARIIGMLRDAAAQAQDELLMAMAAYVRGETFFASGDLATGARMLGRAASGISLSQSPMSSATYGSMHMRAAVMSARAGRATDAEDHMAEAHMVAQQVNEGVHLGTAFGAASYASTACRSPWSWAMWARLCGMPPAGNRPPRFLRNAAHTSTSSLAAPTTRPTGHRTFSMRCTAPGSSRPSTCIPTPRFVK
jgi:transcriptional regulator with XRE-family HTH domain